MENRRTLLALVLSFAVIVLWGTFFVPAPPKPLMGPPEPVPTASSSPTPGGSAEVLPGTEVEEPAAGSAVGEDQAESAPTERVVRIKNGLFNATIRGTGGVLSSLALERYAATPQLPEQPREPMELVGPPSGEDTLWPLGVTTGDRSLDAKLATARFIVEGDDADLRPGEAAKVTLRFSDGRGTRVAKTLEFHGDSYVIDVSASAHVAGATTSYLVLGPGLAGVPEPGHKAAYAERANIHFPGARVERIARVSFPIQKLTKEGPWPPTEPDWLRVLDARGRVKRYANVTWAGLDENYFAALAFADPPLPEVLVFPVPVGAPPKPVGAPAPLARGVPQPSVVENDARMGLVVALPHDASARRLSLYCGPKDTETLRAVRPDLAAVVELGFFQWFGLYLLAALKFFHGYVHNYGIAIILLTICVKIAFLPLTIKQLNTMQKLATLRPQLKEIENRHGRAKGDAREKMEANRKMREEQMELYSREGVNPAGGCLPLLLQLPVLWAFYSLLGASIELRHAPFVLWIQDLSAKDPFYVTPGLMVLSMIVLQTLTPSTADPAQQRLMYLMPLVFAFIFKDLASGLVLYWLTQNVLSIAQQIVMNRLTLKRERREKMSRRFGKA